MAEPTKAQLQEQLADTKTMYEQSIKEASTFEKKVKKLEMQLAEAIAESEGHLSALGVVKCILELSEEEQKELPNYIRTNELGIQAYSIFQYGGSGIQAPKPDKIVDSVKSVV